MEPISIPVPEILPDGVGGIIVNDVDEMVRRLDEVDRLDPAACRAYVESRFTVRHMLDAYEATYERVLHGVRPLATRSHPDGRLRG